MSDQDNRTPPVTPGHRRAILLTGTASLASILLLVSIWWFFSGQWRTTTDDAYVGGDIVAVTPLTGGTVIAIHGDVTQAVAEGQLLVQLDDDDARLKLQAAESALAAAVREVRGLYAIDRGNRPLIALRRAELARAEAELARNGAALAQAESEFGRREALARRNFVSAENVQQARTARDEAQAQYDAAASAVEASRAAIAQTQDQASASGALVDNTSLENHPNVQAAAVRVREATLALARTRVRAPVSGQVAKRMVQLGERVAPGAAMMSIVPLDKVWLDANFKETELRNVRIGQPATLTADFYGSGIAFHGKVLGLAPGSGSAFALLPPQNATGNWIKIVQRLPVRIALDAAELQAHPLRIGLSADVSIDTHDRSGAMLRTLPDTGVVAATAVYAQDIQSAGARVARIIADNLGRK